MSNILENITVRISSDLKKARNNALAMFRKRINLLTPKSAPLSWDSKFDVYELKELFDTFITERETLAKISGVLRRDRIPLEISFHTFFSHPLGRDYRQDVVTAFDGDQPFYDPKLAKAKDILVKPTLARSILKEQLSNKKVFNNFTRTDSEFAREMLMFPLSIKNPAVPLLSAKGRRKVSVPKKDVTRKETGPERYLLHCSYRIHNHYMLTHVRSVYHNIVVTSQNLFLVFCTCV